MPQAYEGFKQTICKVGVGTGRLEPYVHHHHQGLSKLQEVNACCSAAELAAAA
jgi:hypothetical protein